METLDVAVIVGSLRKGSFTRMAANALVSLSPQRLRHELIPIGDLPLYNQDLETSPPEAWRRFRDRIRRADALLFVTPEYNRSVPGALKNAVDVGSRPYGHNVWNGKPGAVVSVTPGSLGALGSNHHLRQSLMAVNVLAMAHPEAYIGEAANLFSAEGELIKDGTRDFFTAFMQTFAIWADTLVASQATR